MILFLYQKLREAKVELMRFLIIGGLSTILNYLVFLALLHGLNFNYLIANALGFIAGVGFGYPFNKKWTFGHQQKNSRPLSIRDMTSWHEPRHASLQRTQSRISMGHTGNSLLPKYCLVYLASLLLSIIFLKIAVGLVGISPEIANIFAICLTTCTNFLGTKFFVFKKSAI